MSDLERFITAQDPSIDTVLAELSAGRKRSHWMWFVFPQLAGLGHSAMAAHYAIRDLAEASDYLRHPVLGPRLADCTGLVLTHRSRTAHEIFGTPDDVKLRSSMTLFDAAARGDLYAEVIERFFDGERDPLTLRLLATR